MPCSCQNSGHVTTVDVHRVLHAPAAAEGSVLCQNRPSGVAYRPVADLRGGKGGANAPPFCG